MALFFEEDLHVSIFLVGIVFTFLSVGSIIFSVVGGFLADTLGRKGTLLIGSTASFSLYLIIAAGIFFHFPVLIIMVLFVLTSFGGALVFPSANALIADVTSAGDRMNGYVIYRIISNLGWAIGPLTGSLIFNFGILWIFLLVAFSSMLQGIVVLFFVKDRGNFRDGKQSAPK